MFQGFDNSVFGTALCVALLELCYSSRRPEWSMLAVKAKAFMRQQLQATQLQEMLDTASAAMQSLRSEHSQLIMFNDGD